MNTTTRHPRGFALISALAVLTILVILVVAFATTMRTERSASQNFLERERAQAIGQAMLNRIMADHSAPEVAVGGEIKPLKPFAVDEKSKLPTADTRKAYIGTGTTDDPPMGIYVIEPMEQVSNENKLIRISMPAQEEGAEGGGEILDAYTPEDWAWARQRDAQELLPKDQSGTPIAPKWVDYFEERGAEQGGTKQRVPVGEVAFTVWDESGSFDINMAGPDLTVNGVAPHDLGFEMLSAIPTKLLSHLDRQSGRQRSNFSLRTVSANDTKNNMGDDRWFFSSEEIMEQNLFTPDKLQAVTTYSRDFDVRPEWDGDRNFGEAQKYLRSYVNNEKLFQLFTHSKAGAHLVRGTLDERQLNALLKTRFTTAELGKDEEDWMQIMRLLATLRMALPVASALDTTKPLPMNQWNDFDIFGIALNIMQATAPASDYNLFAYDRAANYPRPFEDANVRMGVRVSPYITEIAMRAERLDATKVRLQAYMELWNPYPYPLNKSNGQPIRWFFGNWVGSQWNGAGEADKRGIYDMTFRSELPSTANITAVMNGTLTSARYSPPEPGKFVTIPLGNYRDVDWPAGNGDLVIRARPYIQNQEYYLSHRHGTGNNVEESSSEAVSIGPFYNGVGANPNYNLIHSFERDKLLEKSPINPAKYAPVWHSFQIDDPRMGPYTRYTPYGSAISSINNSQYRKNETPMVYSWKAFTNSHSLFGIADEPASQVPEKNTSKYGDGYNQNFGENWPPGIDSVADALATFALPMRPFQNVGELGTVFANRPWRTLSFALTTVPTDKSVVPTGNTLQSSPTALLDYLTTVGTTSNLRTLNFKNPAAMPPGSYNQANVNARKQDKRWLFESVDKQGFPTGPLRPIRGRINLNSATKETITTLLAAPYRMVRSLGLLEMPELNPRPAPGADSLGDILIDVKRTDAELIAKELVGDAASKSKSIRPLRAMSDLARLTSIKTLHERYPDAVVDAMVARLAQFGTVRQQTYTVDMVARSLNTNQELKRLTNPNLPRVVTAEVRFQARVYFDTFSRKGFIESIEYR